MKNVLICLTARNDRVSNLYHCGGSCGARASLFESEETPRKQFYHSGGPVKLMQACLCA